MRINGINVKDYLEKKEAGLISTVAADDAAGVFEFTQKYFDVDTGRELDYTTRKITMIELEARRDELLNQVKDFNDIIADLKPK